MSISHPSSPQPNAANNISAVLPIIKELQCVRWQRRSDLSFTVLEMGMGNNQSHILLSIFFLFLLEKKSAYRTHFDSASFCLLSLSEEWAGEGKKVPTRSNKVILETIVIFFSPVSRFGIKIIYIFFKKDVFPPLLLNLKKKACNYLSFATTDATAWAESRPKQRE